MSAHDDPADSSHSSLIGRPFVDVLWSGVCGCGRSKRVGGAWCRGCGALLLEMGVAAEVVGYRRCLEALTGKDSGRFSAGEVKDDGDGWGEPGDRIPEEEKVDVRQRRPEAREVKGSDGGGWAAGVWDEEKKAGAE